MSGVQIRAARRDEAAVLAAYNVAMAKETEDLALDEQTVRAGAEAVLRDPAKGSYFVVTDGDMVVAQLMVTYEWSDWRNAQCWWVQSVYVHPEHRKKGHYRALYSHVRQLAKDSGASGIRLYADNDNARANTTYESLGMSSHYRVWEESFVGY